MTTLPSRTYTCSIALRAVAILMAMVMALSAYARQFEVASFRHLPNDVTAFITPVRDLNDNPCALLKVEAAPEFAFSTPLGIVKREDHTGEVWLYVPAGTRKLTLKHPQWGVLRDYLLPERVEGQCTYELRLKTPPVRPEVGAGSVPGLSPGMMVVNRTDTVVISVKAPRTPFSAGVTLNGGYGGRTRTFLTGVTVWGGRQWGAFLNIATDFGNPSVPALKCGRYGDTGAATPWYSGKTRHGLLIATVGMTQRAGKHFTIMEGVGYGVNSTAWQLAPSEGGGYLSNTYFTTRGVAGQVGAMYRRGRLSFSASVISIKLAEWYGQFGIGFVIK